ncbi:RNA polymerase sigma factor [Gilvimarinus agarilyticus]|uniref:RNA polymerase sigma factor n=1 Tax=Reichenbachiella agariperforans TaxID=156994 RepID=UPI001C08A252|nr:RNA polymerase sigma factor [Reichenbachiella agariperforans]MBU2887763.1 RNA polymerase sigma factor [Gilvimarinus agarilyticus]MBU2914088.1 RNA polymerase sigma factor [Reichenbachiella agariperforans]
MIEENKCIEAIANGSQEALEQLYTHYSDRVYNTLISYTKNTEDAEELLQDVFVTIYHTAHSFQFSSSISTWIYRIAVNKSLDFLRKKKSQKRAGIFTSIYLKNSTEIKYESPDFVHPGVKLENKEDAKLLFRAIDNLSENQKTAFILTQIEGLPQKEVAEIMDQSRKSIESLVQRAKQNLKQALEKHYPGRGIKNKNTSK